MVVEAGRRRVTINCDDINEFPVCPGYLTDYNARAIFFAVAADINNGCNGFWVRSATVRRPCDNRLVLGKRLPVDFVVNVHIQLAAQSEKLCLNHYVGRSI